MRETQQGKPALDGRVDLSAPRPGDKIRVTYETTVNPNGGFSGQKFVNRRPGQVSYNGRIEVIERADDPSKDPIGTVRKAPNGALAIRMHVLRDGNRYAPGWREFLGSNEHADDQVVGWPKQSLVDVARVFDHKDLGQKTIRVFAEADGHGDRWFELVPNLFTFGDNLEDAREHHSDGSTRLYRDWTLERLKGFAEDLQELDPVVDTGTRSD